METTDGGRVELAKEGVIDEFNIVLASAILKLTLLIALIVLGVVATEGPRLKLVEACGFLRGGAPTGGGGGCIFRTTNHSTEQYV